MIYSINCVVEETIDLFKVICYLGYEEKVLIF